MHLRCPMALCVLAGLLLGVSPAGAQEISPRVVFLSSIGYNDNVTNAASFPKEGAAERVGDGFVSIGPTASLSYNTPNTQNRFTYTFDARFNFVRTGANTFGNKLAYSGQYDFNGTTSGTLSLSAKEGRLGGVRSSDPAAEAAIETLPAGLFTYLDLGADERLTRDLNARTRVYQLFSFSERIPFVNSSDYATGNRNDDKALAGAARARATITNAIGIERDYPFDIFGLDLNVAFLETADLGRFLNGGTAAWSHNFEHLGLRGFTSRAEAGVVQILRADAVGGQFWQPTGKATLTFDDTEDHQISLAFVHSPTANLINGTLNYIDSLTLRGSIPLERHAEWILSGTAGWQRALQISNEGETGDPQDVFQFDTQVSYAPLTRYLSNLKFSLRYTRRVQLQMPLAQPGFIAFDGSEANTVMFTLATAWPSRERYRAPFLLSPTYQPEPSGLTDVLSAPAEAPSE